MHACVCWRLHVYEYMVTRGQHWFSCSTSLHFILENSFSLKLNSPIRLNCLAKWVQGILLSLLPWHWGYNHVCPYLAFIWEFGVQLSFQVLMASTLSTKPHTPHANKIVIVIKSVNPLQEFSHCERQKLLVIFSLSHDLVGLTNEQIAFLPCYQEKALLHVWFFTTSSVPQDCHV